MSGKFIVVEGGNGAGKTSVLKSIEQSFTDGELDHLMTREPGGTPVGEEIRKILLNPDNTSICPMAELMLFAAARAQHLQEKIIPALNDGYIVVSDRFDSSTYAFQHYGRGLPLDTIKTLNELALDGFKPDLTIILDIDVLEGLKRTASRGALEDRFENEDILFLERVRQGYLEQAKQNPDRFVVIDASQTLEEVIKQVKHVIRCILD